MSSPHIRFFITQLINVFICSLFIWRQSNGLCIRASCLTELTEDESNATLQYVLDKYDQVKLKIMGQPVSIYGMRLTYDDEEELNIHFKYVDNTQQDVIQNCVFVIYHRSNECELIQTICNTFLPITPRPLLKLNDLRVCNDNDVQLVEMKEFVKELQTEATPSTTSTSVTEVEQEHVDETTVTKA
ncbi:uncharacterized protein ACN2A1_007625 isoform 2-T2 [Glossina fuscipes fuscipes]